MEGLTGFDLVVIVGVGLLGVYLAARLISAAFFNSKSEFERKKHE